MNIYKREFCDFVLDSSNIGKKIEHKKILYKEKKSELSIKKMFYEQSPSKMEINDILVKTYKKING